MTEFSFFVIFLHMKKLLKCSGLYLCGDVHSMFFCISTYYLLTLSEVRGQQAIYVRFENILTGARALARAFYSCRVETCPST